MTDYVKGIDVSAIQGNIDWQSVAGAGYQFVICKNYQGNDGPDHNYVANITGASSAGLQVATYNFIYPLPNLVGHANRDPAEQAKLHFDATKTAIVCVDIEWPAPEDWAKWGCSANQINDWCLKYLDTYSSLLNALVLVYTYPYFAKAVKFSSDITKYPLWMACYEPTPSVISPWTDWILWQNSGGTVRLPNGTPVDTDLAKDLSLWGK